MNAKERCLLLGNRKLRGADIGHQHTFLNDSMGIIVVTHVEPDDLAVRRKIRCAFLCFEIKCMTLRARRSEYAVKRIKTLKFT
ncbi:unknown [Sutterella wadsworthensis CAG:135]|nr:unknown [Sutterella wadsworthensis CAG:135]